jgi:two-component system, response regulator PdtaR
MEGLTTPSTREKSTVLVVEDEFITGTDLQRRLKNAGYDVPVVVDTGKKAIATAGDLQPDIVLMDIALKEEMTGIVAAKEIGRLFDIPVIFLSSHADETTVDEAVRSEPFGYLIKPVDDRALKTAIQMGLYKHAMDLRLRESEERYRTMANLVDESVYIISRDYSVLYINQCAAALLNVEVNAVTGKTINDVLEPSVRDAMVAALEEVFTTGKPVRRTSRFGFPHAPVWLDTSLIPFRIGGTEVTSVLGISRDITARVLLEQAMEQEGISRIEKNMEEFQVLNDQIRNPLQIITALTNLDNGPRSEKILEQVAIIDDLVTRLDKGWVESEKVRTFLLRHYGHGQKPVIQ